MALSRKIAIPSGVTLTQETTKELLRRQFPEYSVSNYGSWLKIKSVFVWGVVLKKSLLRHVRILLIQEKTFGGQKKGDPYLALVKGSSLDFLGPLFECGIPLPPTPVPTGEKGVVVEEGLAGEIVAGDGEGLFPEGRVRNGRVFGQIG